MAIYNNLKTIRRLTNASLTSLIDVTNLNFKSISDANLEFLNNINYDEATNSFSVYSGKFDFAEITNKLTVSQSGIPTFIIESSGEAVGKTILVEVSESKRKRFTAFPDYPAIGVPGEIIYTGVDCLDPVFGEDVIVFLQDRGWVSLTDGTGGGGGGGSDFGHKKFIATDELLIVQEDYQYLIYGNFKVAGLVNNYGEIVIINGTLILYPGGQVNNCCSGLVKIVNLATGTSVQVVIRDFTAAINTPVTIVHGLNTKDFVYSVREGDLLIDVDLQHIDDNTVELLSSGTISDGRIVFQAKI